MRRTFDDVIAFKLRSSGSAAAPPAWARSAAGCIGVAAALGFSELASGFSEAAPSLLGAVGKLVVDYTPGDVIAVSIDTLGSSQKTVLTAGIIVTSLVAGGAIGRVTTIQQRLPTAAGFAVFGVIGGWAAARYPSGQDAVSWRVALLAALLGIAVTLILINRAGAVSVNSTAVELSHEGQPVAATQQSGDGRVAASGGDVHAAPAQSAAVEVSEPGGDAVLPTASPVRGEVSGLKAELAERRAFLAWAGTAGAAALALTAAGRYMKRGPSAAETARDAVTLSPRSGVASGGVGAPAGQSQAVYTPVSSASSVQDQVAALDTLDEVAGLSEYVSSNSDFYLIHTALIVPRVDPADWRLSFTGMVDTPYELAYDEILDMDDLADHVITLSCVSNEVGGELVGNAVWTGVPLGALLDRAGVQAGATQVVGRSVDGWTAGFPTDVVYDGRSAILAVGMNGEPLPIDHGFPARLVVAGLYGYVSAVKWVEEIRLTTWEGFDGFWVPRGWSKLGPIKTQSRIDVPGAHDRLSIGAVSPIAGVAWAPTRGISAVEVRVPTEAGTGETGWNARSGERSAVRAGCSGLARGLLSIPASTGFKCAPQTGKAGPRILDRCRRVPTERKGGILSP